MFDTLLNLVILFGLITLAFLSPACMNVGLVRVSNDGYAITKGEFLMCCIPVFNHFYGWKRYTDKYISWAGISSILLLVSIALRTYVMVFNYYNNTLQVVSIYIFLACVVAFWVCHAITIYSVLSDSGIYTFRSKVFNAFTVVIGEIIVGYYMPRKMYYYQKKEKGSLYGRS